MNSVKEDLARRRAANATALAAFGLTAEKAAVSGYLRTIREGGPATVFTVGYERRSSEDLISRLLDAGVEVLADIREKPISRRADFRAAPLREACVDAKIAYQAWPLLGSKESHRDDLHESGDINAFHKKFRTYARRCLMEQIELIATEVARRPVALFCYERDHEDCHRMVVAELIAERIGAGIIAIV
jgi:uncharacterized protein (DUF488 family)